MLTVVSESPLATKSTGAVFARSLIKGDTVILKGSLGAGKTVFVKGAAAGLGCREKILSPSFTLVRQYRVKGLGIYHLDLYRLQASEFSSIGIETYLYAQDAVSFIEWGEKIENYLDKYLCVDFSFLELNKRKISFSQKGHSKERLKNLKF